MPNSGYDKIADEYYQAGHQTSRNFDHATSNLLSGLQTNIPFGMILEVGAGRGRAVEFLNVTPRQLVQLDNSDAMLRLVDREDSLLRIHADACRMPMIEPQFSAVVGFLVDPFMGLDFLAEAHRMLKDSGLLLLTVPTKQWGDPLREKLGIDPTTTRFKLLGKEEILVLPSLLHSPERLREMLALSGFKKIDITDGFLPENEQPISPDISSVADRLKVVPQEIPIIHVITAYK